MVGHQVLVLGIGVRAPVPEPIERSEIGLSCKNTTRQRRNLRCWAIVQRPEPNALLNINI